MLLATCWIGWLNNMDWPLLSSKVWHGVAWSGVGVDNDCS